MKLIDADPKENVRLYFFLLVLLALCFYLFGLRPAMNAEALESSKYQSLRTDIQTGKIQAKELLSYAGRVKKLKAEVVTLEERLRSGNQVLLLLKDAEQAAQHARIKLDGLDLQAPEVKADVTRQPVQVTASGSLQGLLHFAQHMELLPYPVRVTRLNLSTGQAGGAPLQANLSLELYSLGAEGADQSALAKASPGGPAASAAPAGAAPVKAGGRK